MKVADFVARHGSIDWRRCMICDTMEELWARNDMNPAFRIWCATQPGVLTVEELCKYTHWLAAFCMHGFKTHTEAETEVCLYLIKCTHPNWEVIT